MWQFNLEAEPLTQTQIDNMKRQKIVKRRGRYWIAAAIALAGIGVLTILMTVQRADGDFLLLFGLMALVGVLQDKEIFAEKLREEVRTLESGCLRHEADLATLSAAPLDILVAAREGAKGDAVSEAYFNRVLQQGRAITQTEAHLILSRRKLLDACTARRLTMTPLKPSCSD